MDRDIKIGLIALVVLLVSIVFWSNHTGSEKCLKTGAESYGETSFSDLSKSYKENVWILCFKKY